MGQGIIGGQRGEGKRSGYGLFQAPGIAQGTDQSMMSFKVVWIGGNCGSKAQGSFGGSACRELFQPLLRQLRGFVDADLGHDIL